MCKYPLAYDGETCSETNETGPICRRDEVASGKQMRRPPTAGADVPDDGSERHDPVVIHANDEIVYANAAFAALLAEQSRTALVGTPLSARLDSDSRELFSTQCERLLGGDATILGATATLTVDEREDRTVLIVSSVVDWEDHSRIKSTFIDISAVSTSGSVVTSALDEAPVGITVADMTRPDEPLIYVSDGFVEITGYDREEILGQNCRFLQGEKTRSEPVDRMRTAIDAGDAVTVVLRNYRKDGSMFWNRVTLTPVTDDTGAVTHYLGYQDDVSVTKLYQQERRLFETHAEGASHTMFITDSEGKIEYVNPAFERMTGYSAQEAVGKTTRLFAAETQDPLVYEELWETITDGEPWEGELTNRTKHGERYRVKRRVVPIVDDGTISNYTVIEYNITDEAFTEQVLDVMNRMLRHNVRNSIEVIEGYAAMLEDEVAGPGQRTIGRIITERTASLKKMSEQTATIRELFRQRDQRHSLALAELSRTVEQARATYPEATISLTIDVDDEIEIPNGQLLELALEETIENAVVHNDSEEPTVDIRIAREDSDDATVHMAVADNGPSIPETEWEIITAREETALRHGSGIGLWVIYWSITALGGSVERDENEPRGTVLRYRLPVVADEDAES